MSWQTLSFGGVQQHVRSRSPRLVGCWVAVRSLWVPPLLVLAVRDVLGLLVEASVSEAGSEEVVGGSAAVGWVLEVLRGYRWSVAAFGGPVQFEPGSAVGLEFATDVEQDRWVVVFRVLDSVAVVVHLLGQPAHLGLVGEAVAVGQYAELERCELTEVHLVRSVTLRDR